MVHTLPGACDGLSSFFQAISNVQIASISAISCGFPSGCLVYYLGFSTIEQKKDPPPGICLVTNITDGGGVVGK